MPRVVDGSHVVAVMHGVCFTLWRTHTRARASARYYETREPIATAAIERKEMRMAGSVSSWHLKFGLWALAAGLLWLGGCAIVAAPPTAVVGARVEQHRDEDTEARATRVFIYESRVADALLDRYPMREDFAAAGSALITAEADMTEACGALTRAVLRHLEGRQQSVKQKLKVARSLTGCEQAARRIEAMLDLPPSSKLVATGGP